MDKKWILILIILIVGCSCMYLIVDSSTTVGSAITVVNKTVVTLPHDFTIGADDKHSVKLINKHNNNEIYLEDMGKINIAQDCFNNELKKLKSTPDVEIISNITFKIDNIPTYKIDYKNLTTNKNMTFAYVCVGNHTFTIKMSNYDNSQQINENLKYIVSNMHPDFKQSQD